MTSTRKNFPNVAAQFKPGTTGNPGGVPRSRDKLTRAFANALAEDFDKHGVKAIEDARMADPVRYVQIVASLMPKQIEQTQPLDDMGDDELLAAIAFLRSSLTAEGAGAGDGTTH
jgi:hypothetical protein